MAVERWLAITLALAGLALGLAGERSVRPVVAQGVAPGAKRAPTPAPTHVHGTPKGWRFTWPAGNAAKGREVFQKLECYSCHEVQGEHFPGPSDTARLGPELSAMGPMHPPEYLAESIINPSAVIERNHGYAASDGSSKMPSYGDSLTLQETIDLVAYLKSLRPPAASAPAPGGRAGHTMP
jgi:mono/diheme cytochrome c family protein